MRDLGAFSITEVFNAIFVPRDVEAKPTFPCLGGGAAGSVGSPSEPCAQRGEILAVAGLGLEEQRCSDRLAGTNRCIVSRVRSIRVLLKMLAKGAGGSDTSA